MSEIKAEHRARRTHKASLVRVLPAGRSAANKNVVCARVNRPVGGSVPLLPFLTACLQIALHDARVRWAGDANRSASEVYPACLAASCIEHVCQSIWSVMQSNTSLRINLYNDDQHNTNRQLIVTHTKPNDKAILVCSKL